jgi:hypothetical protein
MEAGRSTKGQKRLDHIIQRIPLAREQLLTAIDDLAPNFDVAAIRAAAQSADPRERNKVAVIERELDILIAYMEELASRGWLRPNAAIQTYPVPALPGRRLSSSA